MGGLDSQKSYERTDPSPRVKAKCSVQRQTMGNTFADVMCNPEAPKAPEKTERQIVDENFDKMKVEFEALGIEFNRDFYRAGYYGLVTKDKRPPIELVYGRMNIFFMKAKESNLAKTILHSRSKELLEILQFHLLGKDAEASEHEIELFSNIDAKSLINSLETTIGIKFNDNQAKQLLSQLSGNGINPKEANQYIGEIKNLSPDNFRLLKGSKDLLIQNLLALILTLRGAGSKAKDLVKSQLEVRAKFTQEFIANKKLADENKTVVRKFGNRIENYKKEHPGIELDETLAKYEAAMVDAAHNVAYYEMLQALTTTKSDLALTYLNKSGKNTKYSKAKGVIADIFQSKNSSDIKNLSSKYSIELPATLSSLQTAESNFETKSLDEYIARETGNNSYARDAYDKFYKTGKVEGADKKAILARLAFESDKSIDSSNKLVSRINSESIFFDQLIEKYKNISEVPTKERRAAILKSEGYLQLLNQHAGIQARLLSIAATYDTLGVRPEKTAGDTEKRSWEQVVGDMRQEATESLEKSKAVARFLQINGYESPDLNQASLSRLTLTLIQKENAELEEKYKGTMDNVTNNYENLGDVMNQLGKAQSDPNWAEENGTKLIRIFKQGTEDYDKIIPSINVTRGKFENMKKDLSSKLIEVGKGDSALLKLHPQLKAVYETILKNAIKNVDTALNDSNSPISKEQIAKLELGRKEFKEKLDAYHSQTLKDIGVFSVIMATSIGGGLIGARIVSALVKISSTFLVPAELIAEGTAGARIVSGVSTLLVPAGMSAGGVVGSRAGMELTNKVGWSQFKSEDIWDPAKMRKDFYWGYGLSLGTVLAASVVTRGLKAASISGIASENPAVLNLSQRAAQSVAKSAPYVLDKLGKAKKIFSPLEIETNNSKALLTKFGAQFVVETGEETTEEISARIHPVMGFLASVINASHGAGANLNIAGVDTNKVGLNVEGNRVTYNAKSPAEFVSNLKAHFEGKKDSSFDTKINPDGSVEISIYGKTLHQSIATMIIHPAIEASLPQAAKVGIETEVTLSEALNLSEKIKDPAVKKTAIEITNELLGGAIAKSKEAFMKTAAKFKSISASLQSNAKELAEIFHKKFMQQGGSFGLNGVQILQAIYETGVQFLGGKADVLRVNRKFKIGDTAVYTDGNGGLRDVFVKNVDPQTGEVTLRTDDLSGYEIKVSAAYFLLFNKNRRGTLSEDSVRISDYKKGDVVNVINPYSNQLEGGWTIVGYADGWGKRITLKSGDRTIDVNVKDIKSKKSDIQEDPISQESKELTDSERKLIKKLFPEGIENSHFEQQNTGNCYVLSFLHSFKRHPLAPLFVARMIRPTDGGWNVKFPGEEEVFLPTEELDGKKEWDKEAGRWVFMQTVKGQLGDKILVLAHAKWRRTRNFAHVPGQTVLESGWGHSTEPMKLFLKEYASNIDTVGVEDYTKPLSEDYRGQNKVLDLLNNFSKNPKSYILTASPPVRPTPYAKHIGGEFNNISYYMDPQYRFVQRHSYSIVATNAESRTITIANPHDTKGKEHTISYDEFFQYFTGVDVVKFDPAKIKGVDFMKAPYVEGVINAPLQRAIEARFDAKENLLIKMGPQATIYCELQADGSIFLNMEQATGVRGGLIIKPGSELIVGANTIPNMPGTVSGSHVKVKNLGNGSFTITDLNSTNGTTVHKIVEPSLNRDVSMSDGNINQWLTANKPVRFDSRARLLIGLGNQAKIPCILQSDGSIFLNMEQATGVRGGPIINPGSELVVGANTIPNMPGTVSGSHVKIKNLGNGYFSITDLTSRNGTFVTK